MNNDVVKGMKKCKDSATVLQGGSPIVINGVIVIPAIHGRK